MFFIRGSRRSFRSIPTHLRERNAAHSWVRLSVTPAHRREGEVTDYTLCDDKLCPSRESCYRFKAKPDPLRQSWADFNRKKDEKACADFLPWLTLTDPV
jgi:hypothetical protein